MKNFKLESFTNLLSKNRVLADALNKAKEKIKNGKDFREIINSEIMPIVREKYSAITASDSDIVSYLKFDMNKLTKENMKNVSGGVNAGRLTFGLINGAIALASITNGSNNGFSSSEHSALRHSASTAINEEFNSETNNNTKDETKISLNALLGENEKTLPNTPNSKKVENNGLEKGNKNLKQKEKSLEATDIMQNSTYKVTKIEGWEEERAIIIDDLIDSNKISRLPNEPPNITGNWMPTGNATYEGTVFIVPKNVNCYFNPDFWNRIKTKDGKSILVYRNSNAQISLQKYGANTFD